MKYKFSGFLEVNYNKLKAFLDKGEEITKVEIIERCSGEIDFDLLQQIKEFEFAKIGKTVTDELYLT